MSGVTTNHCYNQDHNCVIMLLQVNVVRPCGVILRTNRLYIKNETDHVLIVVS